MDTKTFAREIEAHIRPATFPYYELERKWAQIEVK